MIAIQQPLFYQPNFRESIDTYNFLDDEKQIALDLHEKGYAVLTLDLPDFSTTADRIVDSLSPLYKKGIRVQDGWHTNNDIRTVATSPQIMRILEKLYGRRPVPFQTLNFRKGTQQKTHADTIHFDSFPRNFMCGVWVALEDLDENNGPLHYYPGTHMLPLYTLEDAGISAATLKDRDDKYRHYEQMIQELVAQYKLSPELALLKKGQALIWSANLLHGGSPIKDPTRSRHSQVTHFYFENCLYKQNLWSNTNAGEISYKRVFNIATNKYEENQYCGKPFQLPLKSYMRDFYTSKIRKVRAG